MVVFTIYLKCSSPHITHCTWRKNKLTASEYDETTWSARTWMPFVTQRLSVVSQLPMAQEAALALGLSVWRPTRVRSEGLGPRHG